ncbi:dolichyl-diphosphooligosaccharide--protein glycosyltransferase subunit stt-3-like isoform X2 [Zophobas morio]|uniref:dolichyl-diphosphooligosaccharide--protein glycosyltransferase subunit stt-3-like isoform X2 n=1 Tax=Zophobas morio TaxID=2755281 RepID=UPI003083A3A1
MKNKFSVFLTLLVGLFACYLAFVIRLIPIQLFGLLIHEFDPWFNFRATKYLVLNGFKKFFTWFDYESWYPLGRPVGTTIYPGMQISSYFIYYFLKKIGCPMSLVSVCCYTPCWYGVAATLFTGLLTHECSRSKIAGAFAALIMAIIPAHIMRSVGCGYDNESVAIAVMVATFYFWARSLRTESSWPFAVIAGLLYVFMAASWGGYVFVLNIIGVHAASLVLLNKYSTGLFLSYFFFFVLGTLGAIQIPMVGLNPLRSLEQMGPMFVFFVFIILQFCETQRKKRNLSLTQLWILRAKVGLIVLAAVVSVVYFVLFPMGYFAGLSVRVKSLFIKHTKTGNPLVDSVAEHQPASSESYFQFLHYSYYLTPLGLLFLLLNGRRNSYMFLVCYVVAAYYFSARMVRLIIFLGPIVSALCGVFLGYFIEWSYEQLWLQFFLDGRKNKKISKSVTPLTAFDNCKYAPLIKRIAALFGLSGILVAGIDFYKYSWEMADALSGPSIVFRARLSDGRVVIVKDYLESYQFLKKNTPIGSRVLAWWDYGYQINGIANRTSIADGNTWNHEHIATLARCLISRESEAHDMIRHLADYVLVWTGGGGDDLAKMAHMVRIGTSVYPNICPGEKYCRSLGFYADYDTPSPSMAASLLYKLHRNVRIYKVMNVDQDSKDWVANPANRVCDQEGSWICRGQYPPKLRKYTDQMKPYKSI